MGNLSKIVLDDETLEVEDTKARTEIGDVTTLKTTTKENLVEAVNECFQKASDGKALIASAITGKGINTGSDATFQTMAQNIAAITTGVDTSDGTAAAGQILSGKIAYVKSEKVVGSMENYAGEEKQWCGYEQVTLQPHASSSTQAVVTVPNAFGQSGYYDAASKVRCNIANLNAGNIKAGVVVGRYSGNGADSTNSITGTFTADATATAAQILNGKTAYVNGAKVTGSMADKGAVSQALNAGGSYTIPAGYHNGSGKVTANTLASQTAGTATAAQILSGKTAWVAGASLTGTMADMTGTPEYTATAIHDANNKELEMRVPAAGYYGTNNFLKAPFSTVANLIGLSASKIVSGNTILGISGTVSPGKKYANGRTHTVGRHPNANTIYWRTIEDDFMSSRASDGNTIAVDPGFTASVLRVYYVIVSGITAYYYTAALLHDGTSFQFDCHSDNPDDRGQARGYSCYFKDFAPPRVGNVFYLPSAHYGSVVEEVVWQAWE